MKMSLHCFANLIPIMILAFFSNSGLINATEVGKRTDALEASAWNESKWISAVDASVVKGHNNGRAADGASWFVSTVRNEQKIVSAKWMTAWTRSLPVICEWETCRQGVSETGFHTLCQDQTLFLL